MRGLLVILIGFLATPLRAQVPTNDRFLDRIMLVGMNCTATAFSIKATKESGEPNHAGNPGGQSLWWAWIAPTHGDLTIHTDGSDFDTLLGVYTDLSVSTLSLVASNDDHGYGYSSRVRFRALGGNQYQIAVDGYSDGTNVASGMVVLTLDFIPQPIARPSNDEFHNRTWLSGNAATVAGSNTNATREPGEPAHAGILGDASVWWSWTAAANEKVRVTTAGSSFDSLLAVYTGSALTNLIEVASNDDADAEHGVLASAVVFDAVAGQTYAIAVDGFDGAMGEIVLSLAAEALRLQSLGLTNKTFRIALQTVAGRTYCLERKDSLSGADWTRLPAVTGNGSVMILSDPVAAGASRFYRAVVE